MRQIAEYYELGAINQIPKVKQILFESLLHHLANFDDKEKGERNKADNVANLNNRIIFHKECNDQGEDECQYVQVEQMQIEIEGSIKLRIDDFLSCLQVIKLTILFFSVHHQFGKLEVIKNVIKLINWAFA